MKNMHRSPDANEGGGLENLNLFVENINKSVDNSTRFVNKFKEVFSKKPEMFYQYTKNAKSDIETWFNEKSYDPSKYVPIEDRQLSQAPADPLNFHSLLREEEGLVCPHYVGMHGKVKDRDTIRFEVNYLQHVNLKVPYNRDLLLNEMDENNFRFDFQQRGVESPISFNVKITEKNRGNIVEMFEKCIKKFEEIKESPDAEDADESYANGWIDMLNNQLQNIKG